MKKYLLTTTAAATLPLLAAIMPMSAEAYGPAAEISTKLSKGRKIGELNYMQPLLTTGESNSLPLLDLKIKMDNQKSKEINLGLVYRYNFNDKTIFGVYGYYDHRVTGSGFSVGGVTLGAEVLSKYVDVRANMYTPQSKRKKIKHNSKKSIEIKGTSIYTLSGGHTYEQGLKGYDFEIGAPVFGFSDSWNNTMGTKLYAAHYNFTGKNVSAITGNRFRIEQPLGDIWIGNNKLKFNINAETQYDKVRKRQNFVGLSAKIMFGAKRANEDSRKSTLRDRMMDTVIRDVDIVTGAQEESQAKGKFRTSDGREIDTWVFVADTNGEGDGTAENPYSVRQYNSKRNSGELDSAIATVLAKAPESKGGREMSAATYRALKNDAIVVNEKNIQLVTADVPAEDAIIARINGVGGVKVQVSDRENTQIIFNNETINRDAESTNGEISLVSASSEETQSRLSQDVAQQETNEIVNQIFSNTAEEQTAEIAQPLTLDEVIAEEDANGGGAAAAGNGGAAVAPAVEAVGGGDAGAAADLYEVSENDKNRYQAEIAAASEIFNHSISGDENFDTTLENALNNIDVDQMLADADGAIDQAARAHFDSLDPSQQRLYKLFYLSHNYLTGAAQGTATFTRRANFLQAKKLVEDNSRNLAESVSEASLEDAINLIKMAAINRYNSAKTTVVQRYDQNRPQRPDGSRAGPDLTEEEIDQRATRYLESELIKERSNIYVERIKAMIPAHLGFADKNQIASFLTTYASFSGIDYNDGQNAAGQNGIGMTHKSCRDVTTAMSMEALTEKYGALDGDIALKFFKHLAVPIIREKVKGTGFLSDSQIAYLARKANDIVPSQAYTNAVNNENTNKARDIKNKNYPSAINFYLASIRMADEIPNRIFNEEIYGYHNTKTILANTIKGILDKDEVAHIINSNSANNIFNGRKGNLMALIDSMGNAARSYNIGVKSYDASTNAGGNVRDGFSCSHGVTIFIADSLLFKHRDVRITDQSPATFSDDFASAMKNAYRAKNDVQKATIQIQHARLSNEYLNTINFDVDETNKTIKVKNQDGTNVSPEYQQMVNDACAELDKQYSLFNENTARKFIKIKEANPVFDYLQYTNLN